MMTISPIWVSPTFTFIQVNSTVRYNINVTNETPNRISTIVKAAIANFNTLNLNNFNTTLRFSQLTTTIDQSDPSIISNSTDIQLYQNLQPSTNQATDFTINFSTPLIGDLPTLPTNHPAMDEKVLSSSQFTYKGNICYLEDDNNGNVRIVQINNNTVSTVQIIGAIDYTSGIILLKGFKPDSFVGNSLQLFVRPADNDVSCVQNTILSIDPSNVNINVVGLSQ
jgi:hypothetical protein